MTPPLRLLVGVHLVFVRDGRVLLGLRTGTGWEDGRWHVPCGHMEERESVLAAATREAKEELTVSIEQADLTLLHLAHHHDGSDGQNYLHLFLRVRRFQGTLENAEPHVCAALRWWPIADLPPAVCGFTTAALDALGSGPGLDMTGWARVPRHPPSRAVSS